MPPIFEGGPEEFLKMLSSLKPQNEPEYEDEGEIICLLKNYPALKDICNEGQVEKKMFKEQLDMLIKRFERDQEKIIEQCNEGSDRYWKQIGDYCEKMGLFPPEFNTK